MYMYKNIMILYTYIYICERVSVFVCSYSPSRSIRFWHSRTLAACSGESHHPTR